MDLLQALRANDAVLFGWIIKILALPDLTDEQNAQLLNIRNQRTAVLNAIDALNAGRIAMAAQDAPAATAQIQEITTGLNRLQGTIDEAQMVLDATNTVLGLLPRF